VPLRKVVRIKVANSPSPIIIAPIPSARVILVPSIILVGNLAPRIVKAMSAILILDKQLPCQI